MACLKYSMYVCFFSVFVQVFISDGIWADILVDSFFDDKFNELDNTWYYYDDNYRVGLIDRPQAAPRSVASVVGVPFTLESRMFRGDTSDNYQVKVYKFCHDSAGMNRFATLPFTFGDSFRTPAGWTSYPYVGIGTELAYPGNWIDLTGARKIRFRIRARKDSLLVTFKVQTYEIDSISAGNATQLEAETHTPFGYYGINVNVTPGTTFQEFEVNIDAVGGDLLPPDWADAALNFNLRRITKLSWEISKQDNPHVSSDTIDIDDVVIVGDKVRDRDPYLWTKTVLRSLPKNDLFNSFDKDRYDATTTSGTYWYAFDDVQYGGSSNILYGATRNPSNSLYDLVLIDGTGYNDTGKGAKVTCRFGDVVLGTGYIRERGFAGIGCNLYDSSKAIYWNAYGEKVKNIYFQYNTTGNISFITFEVMDRLDVGDKYNPDRKYSRGNGIVYFRRLPPTNGRWITVNIPFDSLKIPKEWADKNVEPLNTSGLAKIEWKVQGSEGVTGTLAIDNVFFPCRVIDLGMYVDPKWYVCYDAKDDSVGVDHQTINKKKNDLITVVSSGSSLKIVNANHYSEWNVELLDCSGKRIATCSGAGDNITLPVNKLSSGMYFVHIDSKQKELSSPRKLVPVLITK